MGYLLQVYLTAPGLKHGLLFYTKCLCFFLCFFSTLTPNTINVGAPVHPSASLSISPALAHTCLQMSIIFSVFSPWSCLIVNV